MDYLEEAKKFLEDANAQLQLTRVGSDIPKWDIVPHSHYKFTLTTPLGSMEGDFWDSLYNDGKAITPNEYDLLACLDPDIPDTFEDFCWEFGYDTDSIKALETFEACKKQAQDLKRIFTDSQLEALSEIN